MPTTDEGRQKALDATLDELTKRFGDGTIVRLGDATAMVVDSIPTGSLTVDLALGVGGIPRGRITEIYGPESSGKCVSKDTYCLTEQGLLTVEEVFNAAGHNASCANRIVEQEFALVNEQGRLEQTSHFTWNNRKPVKRIRSYAGLTIEATYKHRLRVINEHGFIVWKDAGEIREGDSLVILRDSNQFGHNPLTADEAKFLGYLVADGALADKNRVAFSNSDPQVVSEYNRIAAQLTETPIRSYAKTTSATIDHHINDSAFRQLLHERYDLDYEKATGKEMPLRVRTAGRDAQIAFLRGYFELECSIEAEKATIEVISASRKLLEQVQLTLLNLGFTPLLREKVVNDTTYYRLALSAGDYDRFGAVIGFETQARLDVYNQRRERVQMQTNYDSIPNLGWLLRTLYDSCETDRETSKLMDDYMGDAPKARLTYDRLAQIIDHFADRVPAQALPLYHHLLNLQEHHFFFDPVVSIEDDKIPTFDVVMPETHSFWSNGMISHNTTLCLHVISEAQKRGGVCAFVDMEHALDPTYAERIGVNMDTLYISQPDTAEQALEIMEALVRSGALDVVVLDSVAALVPRVEIEGEMGDSHVGIQARLMSQALRKLSGAIKQSNVSVMFTNQLREKIGVMYGCFSHNAEVMLADGAMLSIGEIVNQQRPVEVLSWNADAKTFEPKPVISWFKNGELIDEFDLSDDAVAALEQEYVTLSAAYPGGTTELTATPNHMIATPDGFRMAGDLEPGDAILCYLPEVILAGQMDGQAGQMIAVPSVVQDVSYQVERGAAALRYNLEIADNATYIIGDSIVHNSPETTSGGRALKFYASVRLDIRRTESIKQGTEVIGNRTRVRVTKNKVAPPFREAIFDIMFSEGGISKMGELVDLGAELGIIEKRGAFYRYNDGLLGQGRENAKEFLKENPEVTAEIEDLIRAQYGLPPVSTITFKGDDSDDS
jgi:recombination protein RecA